MKRAYQYRLYPTKKQVQSLEKLFIAGQRLYNASLEHRLFCWEKYREPVWYLDQAKDLKTIRKEYIDIGLLNFSACQQVLRRLDKNYREFVKGKRGRPRFKPLHRFRSLEFRFGDGSSLTKNRRLRIQNAGDIKIRWHRQFPAGTKIKDLVLTRHGDGKWFVTFRFGIQASQPVKHLGQEVGIDVGLEVFATLSTGEKVCNPRWYRTSETRLKIVQRRYSQHKSKRGLKRLSQLHAKTQRQRKDFLHKLSYRLTQEFSLLAVEKLDIKNMVANNHKGLNKSIYDAGWGQFGQMLRYKVERTGSKLVEINPAYTSQQCASCGQLVPKILSLRVHDCPRCRFSCDRDLNAALVILSKATGREPTYDGSMSLKLSPL